MEHNIFQLLIASYLEAEHVEKIKQVDHRINVIYRPDLLRPPRYSADHKGEPIPRSAAQEREWLSLLAQADILFDFDQTHIEDLPEVAPSVQWLQATSSGIGQFVHKNGYDTRMPNTIFTTAKGVHAQPLAEFCIMVMLMFHKGVPRMLEEQQRHHWERYAGTDLSGRTLVILGLGSVGQRTAQLAKAFGMHVIGVKRTIEGQSPRALSVDELYDQSMLSEVLPRAEHLVIITPQTPETEGLLGAHEIALLPKGCTFINIGRGAVVDEQALIKALQAGQIGAAGLDVFEVEPLPENSPLWDMPNVLISPHSASTSDRENSRITELFIENIKRFLDKRPLLNVLDIQKRF
ncbi:MAG: D-2-hydroxyacid dehydrogenase [Cyclobacteriaceae bacterium]